MPIGAKEVVDRALKNLCRCHGKGLAESILSVLPEGLPRSADVVDAELIGVAGPNRCGTEAAACRRAG